MYNYQEFNDYCIKEYNNMYKSSKPYHAPNMIVQKSELTNQSKNIMSTQKEPPTSQIGGAIKTGYISVGVFTALQALPVPDAVVTIYLFNSDGEEEALYILVTDENGRIPDVELPVSYDPNNPYTSSEYYFTQYNLRVQAINYYTVNVLDVRIFPDITTVYKIDLIPVMAGTKGSPEKIIVIPPSPIDKSNE